MLNDVLNRTRDLCKKVVDELLKDYQYASILGVASKGIRCRVDSKNTSLSESDTEYGYVIKIYNDGAISEYSFNYIDNDNYMDIVRDAKKCVEVNYNSKRVDLNQIEDEPLVKDFNREDSEQLTDSELVSELTDIKNKIEGYNELIINAIAMFNKIEISKIFISKNKNLSQYYTWSNAYVIAVSRKDNIRVARKSVESFNSREAIKLAKGIIDDTCDLAIKLLDSKPIEPGVYDIITDPSITGLIAHEAFGHGVEMDMFVKNRAKGKDYVGKEVASSLIDMHDGASAWGSVASYFFDDDGILAHDTLIIKNGILQTGISDMLSALELGTKPTGNGRRESYLRKAYSRMTNTYFSKGTSSVEDMIKSIKHGYYLCDTNNGMEDPKNWQIQCTAEYGLEIVDGKFSGKIVSPVVISGYVPDVLKSISMVSNGFEISGSGYCGKGHKEWVRVSDGGPHLKAKVKLG